MIVVDTSALMAILNDEAEAEAICAILEKSSKNHLGAPTKFELLMVAAGRKGPIGASKANELIDGFQLEVVGWTGEMADMAAAAFIKFGRGSGHGAKLNFGDCMAYALAKSLDAPLLFKGNDFAKTDIRSAL